MLLPIKLDGKALADRICDDLKNRCDVLQAGGTQPRLTIVTTNDDPASAVYIRNKLRRCEEIGIQADVKRFQTIRIFEFKELYKEGLFETPIIFQKPLTMERYIDLNRLGDVTTKEADVDGFLNTENIAALASGREPANYPCTPKGIVRLLDEYRIPIGGSSFCVIGRSNIVGRPLARMLEQRDATVTLCHSKTRFPDLINAIGCSKTVISATGDRYALSDFPRMTFAGKVLVDVGMNRDKDGRLCGDFPEWASEYSKAYTPVPGGIGPMTVAMLMEHVIQFYERTENI